MAFLVSVSFSLPLRCASEIESKVPLKESAAFHNAPILSTLANKKSVVRTSVRHTNGSLYSMPTLGYSQDLLPSRMRLPGCASCIFIMDKNVQTIISGYWSGPDFEDGWGFVEAHVDQTRVVN